VSQTFFFDDKWCGGFYAVVQVSTDIYWFGTQFQENTSTGRATVDGVLYPSNALVRFDKTKLHVIQAPMVYNGVTRNFFNLPYKYRGHGYGYKFHCTSCRPHRSVLLAFAQQAAAFFVKQSSC
jgi:hypothetical protein